jgi:DNA-binding CsgD family transcriptional regulator/PAS domain-containing protein
VASWNLNVIEQGFSRAATDVGAWKDAVDLLVKETGSHGALLFNLSGVQFPTALVTDGMQEGTQTYLRDGWNARDERFRGIPLLQRHGIVDDFDVFSMDTIKRHPYYQEFLRPLKLSGYVSIRIAHGDNLWSLSLQRTPAQGHFTVKEKRQLVAVSNSMSSAAAISSALGFATAKAALDAFELSGSAALIVDKQGEVIRANPRAERLLSNDVRIVARRLVAKDVNATTRLDSALSRLVRNPESPALLPPIALPREGRLPLMAYPLRLPDFNANPFAAGRAFIVLVDPEERRRPPEAALRDVFGLTVAEARLAARLACGEALEMIADDLNVTKETARFHLKRIFAKTGARRQAELVALFARLLSRHDENY